MNVEFLEDYYQYMREKKILKSERTVQFLKEQQ